MARIVHAGRHSQAAAYLAESERMDRAMCVCGESQSAHDIAEPYRLVCPKIKGEFEMQDEETGLKRQCDLLLSILDHYTVEEGRSHLLAMPLPVVEIALPLDWNSHHMGSDAVSDGSFHVIRLVQRNLKLEPTTLRIRLHIHSRRRAAVLFRLGSHCGLPVAGQAPSRHESLPPRLRRTVPVRGRRDLRHGARMERSQFRVLTSRAT